MRRLRSLFALVVASSLTAVGIVAAVPVAAVGAPAATGDAPSCSVFSDSVVQVVKPSNQASLVTLLSNEAKGASDHGFTDNQGEVFKASTSPGPGLVEVHRLYRSVKQDFVASADPDEYNTADGSLLGYREEGVSFYASAVPEGCLSPVVRYEKSGRHRLAAAREDRDALVAAGWTSQGTSFYAGLPDGGTPSPPTPDPVPTPVQPGPRDPGGDSGSTFSFAVMPDTQQEVLSSKDTRLVDRTRWLVKEKSDLNLKFVTHTGDVHNWDTPDHSQYEISSRAMKVLEDANIPYSLAIGNHDTEATGVGGDARDPQDTRALQRDTTTFNSYYNAGRYGGVSGAFEANKVDNVYSLYSAGGKKWMVLVLELWPRASVVSWAKSVVSSHPDYNVIVVTHDYLNGSGGLEQTADYGDTSPQALYNQFVSQYANIKMVVSGHVGFAASRVDTGVHGNKIYDFMTTIHSATTNPTRMFTIDTKAGTIKTWIYCPSTDLTYTRYSQTVNGVDWVG
jgi:hypothetical protein